MKPNRRKTLKTLGVSAAGLTLLGCSNLITACSGSGKKGETQAADISESSIFFSISLAQWSLHNAFNKKELDPKNFPSIAKKDFGISAVEYVNQFYKDYATQMDYWKELKSQCDNEGVSSLLIMCDGEGRLGDLNEAARVTTVENHYKWIDIAKFMGCHSIRVNAAGNGTMEEVKAAAIDGLGRLTEYGAKNDINVIVENHGGYSSNGDWLSEVIGQVNSDYCGTLPDFGNFCIERGEDGCVNEYDRYKGVKQLMPYAKGVSAKSYNFDENGYETTIDYPKILKVVKDAGFKGHIGIEYEGSKLSESDGILATKALLKKVGEV